MTNRFVSLPRALVLSVALTMLTPSLAGAQTPAPTTPAAATIPAEKSPFTGVLPETIAKGPRQVETATAPEQTSGTPQKKWTPRHKIVLFILITVAVVVGSLAVHEPGPVGGGGDR